MIIVPLLLITQFFTGVLSGGDYYWRDWNGTPPKDAFIAGTNKGEPIYVAQALLEEGMFIGGIREGQSNLSVNTNHCDQRAELNTSKIVQVLCTQDYPFYWIETDDFSMLRVLEANRLIKGGVADVDYNSRIYIGRYRENCDTYVGSVYHSYMLYYSDEDTGKFSKEFDVLALDYD